MGVIHKGIVDEGRKREEDEGLSAHREKPSELVTRRTISNTSVVIMLVLLLTLIKKRLEAIVLTLYQHDLSPQYEIQPELKMDTQSAIIMPAWVRCASQLLLALLIAPF